MFHAANVGELIPLPAKFLIVGVGKFFVSSR